MPPQRIDNESLSMAGYVANKYKLPLTGVLTVWALESGWGKKGLCVIQNNCFNIKGTMNGKYQYLRYAKVLDSFEHFGYLISTAKRYKDLVGMTDGKQFIIKLAKAGYTEQPLEYIDKAMPIYNQIVQELSNIHAVEHANQKQTDAIPAPNLPGQPSPDGWTKAGIMASVAIAAITVFTFLAKGTRK